MFVFRSKDSESGKERRRRILLEITKYALDKYNNNKIKAAQYLGVSVRCLQNRVAKYHELTEYKKERNINYVSEQYRNELIEKWRASMIELKKIELETPKEITEVGEAFAAIMKAYRQAKADGWQAGQDIPAIVMAAVTNLGPAIEGLGNIPEEFKTMPAMASMGMIAPITKETDALIDSFKK